MLRDLSKVDKGTVQSLLQTALLIDLGEGCHVQCASRGGF